MLKYRVYGAFTMESILAAAFGREIEIQKGQSDQLTEAAAVIFGASREQEITSIPFMSMLLSKKINWKEGVERLVLLTYR